MSTPARHAASKHRRQPPARPPRPRRQARLPQEPTRPEEPTRPKQQARTEKAPRPEKVPRPEKARRPQKVRVEKVRVEKVRVEVREEKARAERLLAGGRGRVAIVAAMLAVLALGFPAAARWAARTPDLAWISQADALGARLAVSLGVQVAAQPRILSAGIAAAPGYRNPLRAVGGLVPERIDMGVDFSGSGPIYALGDGFVISATGQEPGWPGGGWITYQLTDGPDAGLVIYLAENVTPAVQPGQQVTPETIIGTMYSGGIETGWAQPDGKNAESQLPEAGSIGGLGPFPTRIGASFDAVLISVGVPPAPNLGQVASGLLPAGYPGD